MERILIPEREAPLQSAAVDCAKVSFGGNTQKFSLFLHPQIRRSVT